MKTKKEEIILYLSVIVAFFVAIFFWDKIFLEFTNPDIIGIYSENNYNSFNDILRYILVIILPSVSFLSVKYYYDKDFSFKINNFFLIENTSFRNTNKTTVKNWVLFLFLILIVLEFFSLELPYHKIDTYHDGQRLSSAYKSYVDGSLWSGSFVTVGIFYETLSSKIIWNFLDHLSIGSTRYMELLYVLSLKVLLILLIYNLTFFIKLNSFYKNIFFILNVLIINQLTDYNLITIDLITFREIPVIFLTLLFLLLLRFNNSIIVLSLISLTSVTSMLWGIDRGLVCNILIIFISLYLLFSKDFKKFYLLLSLIIIAWLFFFFYNQNEFYYFLENTISIYKNMNYVHGLIHPIPFSSDPGSARASKNIITILICLILSLKIIFDKETLFNNDLKRSLFFLSLICVLSYIYALGRSDGAHIKHTFGLPIFTLSIYIFYYLCFFFEKKNINYFKKIIVFIFIFFLSFNNSINFNNLKNYDVKLNDFIHKNDAFFLSNDENKFVSELKPLLDKYDCVQLFSNDAAFNYLLRKKSCTKYYFVWSASPKDIQKKFINESNHTKLIISGGTKSKWELPLEKKLNLINDFIKLNFKKDVKISQWEIYSRK